MDQIIARIENIIETHLKELETNPAKTTIKLMIYLFLFKWAYKQLKGV